jgi:hypothetical protein
LKANPGVFSRLPPVMTDFKTTMISLTGPLKEWLLVQLEYVGANSATRDAFGNIKIVNLRLVHARYVDRRHGPPGKKLGMLQLFESIRMLVDGPHKADPDYLVTPNVFSPNDPLTSDYQVRRWRLREVEDDARDDRGLRGASGFHW